MLPLWLSLSCAVASAADLSLPARSADAPGGSGLARRFEFLSLEDREDEVISEVLKGNVPGASRRFAEIRIRREIGGKEHDLIFYVASDYLAIGGDDDPLLMPLSPPAAQRLADRLGCVLPTRAIVDAIHHAAAVKLPPAPRPAGPAMTQVSEFAAHQQTVGAQLASRDAAGGLVAGHKKDIVITPELASHPGRVAIYGWHRADGSPIQPLHLGHIERWVDYSHGVRLVRRDMILDGRPVSAESILADPDLCALISDEGPVRQPRYDTDRTDVVNFEPGVRVVIKSPLRLSAGLPVHLVIYAVPNGNTIEQTIGRPSQAGDDWHYQIQNIGAQTQWLREHAGMGGLVVAYFECAEKSWPAWRRKHDADARLVPPMVSALRRRFAERDVGVTLSGHSGGGALTFALIDALPEIPFDVERIAFLDSNYAFDPGKGHAAKLAQWLATSPAHRLCVLAYEDHVALLNGKTFIGEKAGSWGCSHALLEELERSFEFRKESAGDLETAAALEGRVQFLMRRNPEKKILHTVQVERNGFIHSMLTGTPQEGRGYEYFGERVY